MPQSLPPLDLCYTFSIAAKHLSFTLAGEELHLSQSAISRQIRQLEQVTGITLFNRHHRRLSLTTAGEELLVLVNDSVNQLKQWQQNHQHTPSNRQITVAASVAFAYFWLMPKLELYNQLQPDVDIRILAADKNADLYHDEVDVAILYGDDNWPNLKVHRLFGERVMPACSPDFLSQHKQLNEPKDLLTQPLLHLEGGGNLWSSVDWQSWFKYHGLTLATQHPSIRMNTYPMLIQAAEHHRGVILGWRYITDPLVATGSLTYPLDMELATPFGYFAAMREETQQDALVSEFYDWLIAQT